MSTRKHRKQKRAARNRTAAESMAPEPITATGSQAEPQAGAPAALLVVGSGSHESAATIPAADLPAGPDGWPNLGSRAVRLLTLGGIISPERAARIVGRGFDLAESAKTPRGYKTAMAIPLAIATLEQKERTGGPGPGVSVNVGVGVNNNAGGGPVQIYLPDNGRDGLAITHQERMRAIMEADPEYLEFISQKRIRELHQASPGAIADPDADCLFESTIIGHISLIPHSSI